MSECPITVRVQEQAFDAGAEIAALSNGRADVGAVASFVGLVRDQGGAVEEMTLEHYPGMTERALEEIAAEAAARWPLLGLTVVHRYGALRPGDSIVLAAAASAHREAAFAAAEFVMDYLKTRAPFWKRERGPGGDGWVAARDSDDRAAERWRGE